MKILTIVTICVGIAVLIVMALWVIHIRSKHTDDPFEDMEGYEFEEYCRDLLLRRGFEEVEMTQKSHDYGVDLFADMDGVSYAIQCKCYSDPVGIKAVQEIYAGRDYYDCMVGVVMTNQYFTKPAIEYATKLNIILWDGDYITDLIRSYKTGAKSNKIKNVRSIINSNTEDNIKDNMEG